MPLTLFLVVLSQTVFSDAATETAASSTDVSSFEYNSSHSTLFTTSNFAVNTSKLSSNPNSNTNVSFISTMQLTLVFNSAQFGYATTIISDKSPPGLLIKIYNTKNVFLRLCK